jgi:hypothetical protein
MSTYSRSPGHRVPWWVLIWIKRSPLVFLVFSVACFSVGLVLFTYSTSQVRPFHLSLHNSWSNLSYVTEQGNVYHHNSTDGIHVFWSHCCVRMVRLRTMDIQSSSREKMARGCSARCIQEVSSSSGNSTRDRRVSMEWCAYQGCGQFLETSSLKDHELPQFQRGKAGL